MSEKPAGSSSAITRPEPGATPGAGRRDHQTQEWSSGTRGGGKVPADFGWFTNPKQYQEESGSSTLEEERQLEREKFNKR